MQRTLLLMRHAKSSWADAGMLDYDRPLNARGRESAPKMAEWLIDQRLSPDLIISSTAARAIETLELVIEAFGYSGPVDRQDRVYLASLETLVQTIDEIQDRHRIVLIIGHNPGLEMLLRNLVGGFNAMPTAAIAWLECQADTWDQAIRSNAWQLKDIAKPKEID